MQDDGSLLVVDDVTGEVWRVYRTKGASPIAARPKSFDAKTLCGGLSQPGYI